MVAQSINALLTSLFSALLWPLKTLDPSWGMVFVSLLAGILMVWIFGRFSNQEKIGRVRDRIGGNLIGIHLFRHDLRVVMRLQGSILLDTLTYMKHSFVPLLVMIVPVILILAQLHLRYAARPLEPGEKTLIKVKVRDASTLRNDLLLEAGEGLAVETEGVRIPSEREADWRIRAERPGAYLLTVRARKTDPEESGVRKSATEKAAAEKRIVVGFGAGLPVAVRSGRGVFQALLYPGEAPLPPDSPYESIEVLYPSAALKFFGWRIHWLVAFCVFSILFGFLFKGVLGVRL